LRTRQNFLFVKNSKIKQCDVVGEFVTDRHNALKRLKNGQ